MDELLEGAAEPRADLRERAHLDAVDALALVELLDGVAVDAGATDDFGEGADFAVVHDFAEVTADGWCHRRASLVADRRVHRAMRPGFARNRVFDEHRAGERVGKGRLLLLLVLGIRLRRCWMVARGLRWWRSARGCGTARG